MLTIINRLALAIGAAVIACAPAGAPSTGPTPGGGGGGGGAPERVVSPDQLWPIKTREHVDLWLHGFAMLQDDTTLVPFFRRGYRDQLVVARNSANVTTRLDSERERLRARFAVNRQLINAQFLPLYFSSVDELRQAIGLFLQAEGNPRAAGSQQAASVIALLAGNFPTPADRDWLRDFWSALSDESTRFYHDYWLREQRARSGALAAADSLWQNIYRPAFQRFLANTQQGNGTILFSLPLDGEGRTLHAGKDATIAAVTFPDRREDAVHAVFVVAHELVASVTSPVVIDNLTPAEQRSGLADRYVSNAAVRGGAMLLQRLTPAVADDYARYYLRAVNRSPGSNPLATLATVFPLTEDIRTAIVRQFDLVLGGI